MLELMPRPSAHLIQDVYGATTMRSIAANEILTSAIASTSDLSTQFGTDRLSQQLRMVARMIAARAQLGVKRQVFFVGVGTFDHHDGLVTRHPEMLTQVNDAMSAFYRATEELNVPNNVTAFTASEFGRTISSNGDGSDHGWGSHHMVMGGAVNGREIYGQAPELGNNGPDDVGKGRLIPSTSVDQYAATLGSWFGVNNTELNTIFPRLSEFDGTLDFV